MVTARSFAARASTNPRPQSHDGTISIKQLSEHTAIKTADILSTLHALNMIKYWKGQHMLSVSPQVLKEHLNISAVRNQVDPAKLHWTPHELRKLNPS